jgi:putative phage-type endonuclease
VNASDAPIIMMADPFSDPYRLWQEKTGRLARREFRDYWEGDELVEHPVHHGNRLEEAARQWYCCEQGVFAPPVCIEHPELEWMGASLDGSSEGVIVEIKCPRDIRVHLDAREGQVPESHWIQCQHAMCVAMVNNCDYVSFFESDRARDSADEPSVCVVRLAYNREFTENILIPAERQFWQWVKDNQYPLPQGTVDVDPADHVWRGMVSRWMDARRAREQAEREETAALRDLRLRTRGAARTRDGVVEIRWFVRRGWVNWSQIPEVQEVAARLGSRLDDYRRPSNLTFRIARIAGSYRGESDDPKLRGEATDSGGSGG